LRLHIKGSCEGDNAKLKGADMGKITKTVIEDVAYQLKSAGQWVVANKYQPKKVKELDIIMDLSDPEDVIDDLIIQLADVFATHDKTFDKSKFLEQSSYKLFSWALDPNGENIKQ